MTGPRALAAVLVALALSGAACTSHAKRAAVTTTSTSARGSTASSAPSTSAPSTSAPSSGSSPSTAPSGGVGRCPADHLALGHDQPQGAAGSTYVHLSFTNRGGQPCSLKGYPGLQLVDANGHPVATTVNRGSFSSTAPPGVVVIQPGGEAWFGLQVGDVCTGTGATRTSSAVLVIPPDETHQLRTSLAVSYCDDPHVIVTAVRTRQEDV